MKYTDALAMSPEADSLAAAVAAAAEIAKNSNMFIDVEKDREEVGFEKAGSVTHGNENTSTSADGLVEEDTEKRLARSRERNREHARRTRLRKKTQMEALQLRVAELQEQGRRLKQSVEECSIASILVGLSSGNPQAPTTSLFDAPPKQQQETPPRLVKSGKRKRFVVDLVVEAQPLKLDIEGQTTLIGSGKTHINWKSGVYCDDSGAHRQLTQEQLESLRYAFGDVQSLCVASCSHFKLISIQYVHYTAARGTACTLK
jgi:hypothetical protein